MEVFIACLILGTIFAAIINSEGSGSSPSQSRSRPNSQKSKQVVVKKDGQYKRYRINQYGEIFEE
jgi:hypothetical protein